MGKPGRSRKNGAIAGLRRIGAAAAGAALACALCMPAPASADLSCQGQFPGTAPKPQAGGGPLVFGVYPLGLAGQVGPPAPAKPENATKREGRLRELSGISRPFVAHLYVTFRNRADLEDASKLQLDALGQITAAGFSAEVVMAYRPDGGGAPSDVPVFAAFVRGMVDRLASNRRVTGIQVTNEANNNSSPDASDGSFGSVKDALIEGVVAAKDESRARGRADMHVGFNWFYRLDPSSEDSFWSYLGQHGGDRLVRALDWVGLDAYPGTFFPPSLPPEGASGDARDAIVNALSVLRDCYMPQAKIPASVPIHVTENGYPTGPGRSEEQQAQLARSMITTVVDYRRNYNVSDYRWFSLRDGDTSSPNFQQQYGLLHDDYSPKPAFWIYRDLIARYGAREPGAGGRSRRCLSARAAIGKSGIGRARLGQTRTGAERKLGTPTRRSRRAARWCVTGGGTVRMAFSRRGRALLVASTGRGHRARRIGPGASRRALRRAFRRSRPLGRGLYRRAPRSRVVFGVRGRRVRFVAVVARPLRARRSTLLAYLRRAGLARR